MNNTTSIRLLAESKDMTFHGICKLHLLHLIAVIKEFLNDIVSIDILHQLTSVWHDFIKQSCFIMAVGSLELCLQESGTLLIAREFNDMAKDISKVI